MLGGQIEKWCLPAPLFLERSPCVPILSGQHSEISKSFCLPSVPSVFQIAGSMLYLHGLFVLLSP